MLCVQRTAIYRDVAGILHDTAALLRSTATDTLGNASCNTNTDSFTADRQCLQCPGHHAIVLLHLLLPLLLVVLGVRFILTPTHRVGVAAHFLDGCQARVRLMVVCIQLPCQHTQLAQGAQ